MSTGTNDPASTDISLTYEDGSWVATDEDRGVSRRAETRRQALAALDRAIADTREPATGAEDPFLQAPTFASGRADGSESVDATIADEADSDE